MTMKPNSFHPSCWRRFLSVAALLAILVQPSCADDSQLHQLCVWLTGGQRMSYVSTDHPRILPSDGNLRVQTDLMGFDIPRISVLRITMEAVSPNDPTAISLPSTLEMSSRQRETVRLTPELTPAGSVTTLSWGSSDQAVVRVADDGTLTPVLPGEATVTVRTANGLAADCRVSVLPAHMKLFVEGVDRWGDPWRLGYDFDEQPLVMNRGATLVVATNSASILYPREQLVRFTLQDVVQGDLWTGIADAAADRPSEPSFRAGDLSFDALSPGEHVRLYDAAGRLAAEARADADGHLQLPTQTLPPGIYVVSTEHATFKIQRK